MREQRAPPTRPSLPTSSRWTLSSGTSTRASPTTASRRPVFSWLPRVEWVRIRRENRYRSNQTGQILSRPRTRQRVRGLSYAWPPKCQRHTRSSTSTERGDGTDAVARHNRRAGGTDRRCQRYWRGEQGAQDRGAVGRLGRRAVLARRDRSAQEASGTPAQGGSGGLIFGPAQQSTDLLKDR